MPSIQNQIRIDELLTGFTLNGWQVKPMAGLIIKDGHENHLEPKIMDVLLCLASHQGEVVTRDMLLESVWGNVIVSDEAITRCISELRSIFGDTDRNRAFIKTIPRRGYRLLARVEVKNGQEDIGSGAAVAHKQTLLQVIAAAIINHGNQYGLKLNPRMLGMAAVGSAILLLTLISDISVSDQPSSGLAGNIVESTPSPEQTEVVSGTSVLGIDANRTIRSIAVLPLVNLSGIPENDLFAEGLSEDIRNALLAATDLMVAARTSSSVFKNRPMDVREIAKQLNVDALLEGTIRINENRLKVTTQLTHASDGYSIWSASFERDLEYRIQLQTEIAEEIARQLAPSISSEASLAITGSTANVVAKDYYILGRHHWHKRTPASLHQALVYFQQAITLDPEYALAYTGLSDALVFQTSYDDLRFEQVEARAREAASVALDLAPDLAEAHASMGMLLEHSGDMTGAKEAYSQAVILNRQNSMAYMWLGNIQSETLEIEEAFNSYKQALQLDPLHTQIQLNYASALMARGLYPEAVAAIDKFYDVNPNPLLHNLLLQVHQLMGKYDEVIKQAVSLNLTDKVKENDYSPIVEALIALQRFDEAEQVIAQNRSRFDIWNFASLQAQLGVARRNASALKVIAGLFESTGEDMDKKYYHDCHLLMAIYLRGVASFIDHDYAQSINVFNELEEVRNGSECRKTELDIAMYGKLFLATAYGKMGEYDETEIQQLLRQVETMLVNLKKQGWDTVDMSEISSLVRFLADDYNGAVAILEELTSRGVQPFGDLRVSPLFDQFIEILSKDEMHNGIVYQYEATRKLSDMVGIAKLGI